jgi:hypothetical protein
LADPPELGELLEPADGVLGLVHAAASRATELAAMTAATATRARGRLARCGVRLTVLLSVIMASFGERLPF